MPSCKETNVLPGYERDILRAEFVRRSGWDNAGESLLAGDASPRKYFRLRRSEAFSHAAEALTHTAAISGRSNSQVVPRRPTPKP